MLMPRHFDPTCLTELGFRCVESELATIDLVGTTEMQAWRAGDRPVEVRILYALGDGAGPAALSILIQSDRGSFTYTDWVHFTSGAETPRAPRQPDPDYIEAYSRHFCANVRGDLADILLGRRWIDVPTFRGVNG